ncbi:Periplasmic nitrate reductase precursor [compost metagenome]
MAAPQGYAELHHEDADKYGIIEGEVVRISSPRGSIEVPARISDVVQKGLIFVPFHYGSLEGKQAANELTVDFVDPLSKQPTFKHCACRIDKLRQEHVVCGEETAADIAERYGLSLSSLLRANQLETPYDIQTGHILEVPVSIMNVPLPPYLPSR